MKLNYPLNRKLCGPPREPRRTLDELAEEFGLPSRAALVAQMRTSQVKPPKAVLRSRGFVRSTWYRPSEMRRWWREHKAAKAQGACAST